MPGMRREIEEFIAEFNLGGKVIIPDCCLDWPAACWLATVIVVPNSAPRGLIHELLMAQLVGRPVIVSDCGANKELVEEGVTAWIVPPGDSRALANALREVINLDLRRRLDLARRASDFITDVFPQAVWFNGMMELYDSLTISAAGRKQAQAA
jgi:glycosyltransferase involved in cell wall biosynthesis